MLTADTVAESAEDALEEQVGARPDIACPEDVEAEVGARTGARSPAGDDPTEYGVTVTVTSVEGDNANFDVEVDGTRPRADRPLARPDTARPRSARCTGWRTLRAPTC